MKKNSWSVIAKCFILAGLLLSFGITRISSVYSQEEGNPCQLGDLYLEAGRINKAEDYYADLLKSNPELPCAISGMEKVTSQRELLLKEYYDSENYNMTWPLFNTLLAQSTSNPTIQNEYYKVLTAIAPTPEPEDTPSPSETPTISSYEIAEALVQLGRPDLAYLQIQTAIAEDPSYFSATEIAPTDTTAPSITPDGTESVTSKKMYEGKIENSFYAWTEKVKVYAIEVIEFIGIALAVLLIVFYLYRIFLHLFICKFDIGEFKEGVDITCKPKDSFQAMVEREIWRLSSRNGLNERDIVYQPLEDIDLSGTTLFKLSEIGQIIKVLNNLLPPKLIVLTGTLHYSNKKGAGVTLQMVMRKKSIIDEITLWQSDYDPQFPSSTQTPESECFYKLAEPAALWVAWHLRTKFMGKCDCAVSRWFRERDFKKPNHKLDLVKTFGTANLSSYLNNYIGSQYFRYCPDKVEGKQFLITAYDLDRQNRQAIFNLSNVDIYNITKKYLTKKPPESKIDYSKPRKLLENVIRLSDNVILEKHTEENSSTMESEKPDENDPGRVVDSIKALAYYHLGAISEYEYILNGYQGKVPDEINNHFMKCKKVLGEIEKNAKEDKKKNKEKMISNELEEMIIAAIDGSKCLLAISETGEDECHKDYDVISASLAYNLACNEATIAGYLDAKKTKKQTKSEKEKIKRYLENASKNLADALQDAPSLEPWSKYDPSLDALRKIMVEYEVTPKLREYSYPRALGDIFAISPVHVEKMKKVPGLATSDDLLKAGADKAGRKYLQRRTKLPLCLLENWIKQADLMRVEWISGAYAELLIRSGVDSIAELRKQNGIKLRTKMDRIHKANPLDDYLPSSIELDKWIVKAKSLGIILKIEM
jgi:tetratricopeptide (TPR) repeat protein